MKEISEGNLQSKASKSSNTILRKKLTKSLTEIFLRLDSDLDGIISSEKVDIDEIHPDLLEVFAPLLCEMEDLNTTLNLAPEDLPKAKM